MIGFRVKHAKRKNTKHNAFRETAQRERHLKQRRTSFQQKSHQHTVHADNHDYRFHDEARLRLGMLESTNFTHIIFVNEPSNRVQIRRHCTQRCTEHTRYEESWHAANVAHYIVDKIRNQFVNATYCSGLDWIAIKVVRIHNNADETINHCDGNYANAHQYQSPVEDKIR